MSHNFIVAKFGGSSMADYISMQHSADIVLQKPAIRLVVLSASAGVTNQLYLLAEGQCKKKRIAILSKIIQMQEAIIKRLIDQKVIRNKINHILKNIQALSKIAEFSQSSERTDKLISYGELMSSLLFVEILRERKVEVEWFDVRKVMRTDACFGSAEPKISILKELVQHQLKPLILEVLIVTQGFIGQEEKGRTTTLGRGGSDYTAAILGEALNVKRIDIWTDVSGIYTADPRLVPSAKRIDKITVKEAFTMATCGAKILHPATLLPVVRGDMSIFIGSSKHPGAGGTIVCHKIHDLPLFRALALRSQQTLLTLHNVYLLDTFCFFEAVCKLLIRHGIHLDLIMRSEVKLAVTLDTSWSFVMTSNLLNPVLLTELTNFCKLEVEENLALVSIIGNKLSQFDSSKRKILSLLDLCNIRMVFNSYPQFTLCFLTPTDNAERIIQLLHYKIFE
ncbi:lysine-sensitive aspartokinase 3 [Candidatus Erwinia haradaeae]|uniref:Aspartokinase n=1 Tax=Candidatus Erwinia haradaeae TaxID=1922217 RepID=A0A451D2Z1_9GAMM|nr:lysine-sensitive aspartokinase 3 [Candidatus Erwinia haradaeae]VFP80013.1 Lysine-sensitive aspartokinase 3 [Candidatus Erwinia haradaeae]